MANESNNVLYFQFDDADLTLGPVWERALASCIYSAMAVFGIIGDVFVIRLFWCYRETDFKNSFYRLAIGLSTLDVMSLVGVLRKIKYCLVVSINVIQIYLNTVTLGYCTESIVTR